jgi:hypothetical protein
MQDKQPESNATNNSSQTPVTALNKPESSEGSFSEMQMKIIKLEEDLKYATGAGNKKAIQDEIDSLREESERTVEGKIIAKENDENFARGMSFGGFQLAAMSTLSAFLKSDNGKGNLQNAGISDSIDMKGIGKLGNDLSTKKAFDDFVKVYREKRNNFSDSGYHSNYKELDKLVLNYESAFGIDNGPLIDEVSKLERRKQEKIRLLKNKLEELKRLDIQLLEVKARAPRKILGGIDQKNITPIEIQIRNVHRDISSFVAEAASEHLGINIEKSDMGL